MSGDKLEDAATVAARPEPVVQPWNNPIYHPYHDAVAQLKSTPSTRLITENRRPPKIGEIIVATMAPFDTDAYLIDLGRRYRDNLHKKGEKAARKLAYREARNWIIWAGLIPLLQAVFRVGSAQHVKRKRWTWRSNSLSKRFAAFIGEAREGQACRSCFWRDLADRYPFNYNERWREV